MVLVDSSVGRIEGREGAGLEVFLGVQYASIAGRFARSKLYEGKKDVIIDATKTP